MNTFLIIVGLLIVFALWGIKIKLDHIHATLEGWHDRWNRDRKDRMPIKNDPLGRDDF